MTRIFTKLLKRTIRRFLYNVYHSTQYYFIRNRLIASANYGQVVFICRGNICRSAFAEYYLKSILQAPNVIIESCGLDVDQGNTSPEHAIQAAKDYNLSLVNHTSKGLSKCDLLNSDLIVLMDFKQLLRFKRLYPHLAERAALLKDFSPWPVRLFCNIYDPFGWDEKEFKSCFRKMKRPLDRLAKRLK